MAGRAGHRSEEGQLLVLLAGGLIVMVGLVALVIDGGNAWAQQRQTQNGTDASAQAGATVLAQKLGTDPASFGLAAATWDAATLAAVRNIASENRNDVPVAYYTDICGVLLTTAGARAAGPGDAAVVGGGFPLSGGLTPDCPSGRVGPPAGVQVNDSRTFRTYFASALGFGDFTASATATAVTGFVDACQDVDFGCALLPIAAPVWFSTCSGHDLVQSQGTEWPMNTTVVLPLCFNSPGNIGWIDWSPKAGGASEVKDCIDSPCNPPVPLPSWQFVTQTGRISDSQIETALNGWEDQIVMLPMFDHTCGDDWPVASEVSSVTANYGCATLDDASGSNLWYRMPRFAAFKLTHAYTNGNNSAECQGQSQQCLVGQFVKFVVGGTVGPGSGSGTTASSVIGVQLIK